MIDCFDRKFQLLISLLVFSPVEALVVLSIMNASNHRHPERFRHYPILSGLGPQQSQQQQKAKVQHQPPLEHEHGKILDDLQSQQPFLSFPFPPILRPLPSPPQAQDEIVSLQNVVVGNQASTWLEESRHKLRMVTCAALLTLVLIWIGKYVLRQHRRWWRIRSAPPTAGAVESQELIFVLGIPLLIPRSPNATATPTTTSTMTTPTTRTTTAATTV